MTNESLRRHLAEKVMGIKPEWSDAFRDEVEEGYYYMGMGGNLLTKVEDWKPDEYIEQAFMCLDTFPDWKIVCDRDLKYEVGVWRRNRDEWLPKWMSGKCDFNESLPMAISLACARASNWEPPE